MDKKIDYKQIMELYLSTDWSENSKNENENEYCKISSFSGEIMKNECYKVEIDDKILFLKITDQNELNAIKLLKHYNISVPNLLETMIGSVSNRVALFEDYIIGQELNFQSEEGSWRNVAKEIANMHKLFWGLSPFITNKKTEDIHQKKCEIVKNEKYFQTHFEDVITIIKSRLLEVPYVLSHGDALPNNFLLDGKDVKIIDLENVSLLPYFFDIARLISIPKSCNEYLNWTMINNLIDEYYNIIKEKLEFDKNVFLKDIYIGCFIEAGNICQQMINYIGNREYREFIEMYLHGFANKIIDLNEL